MIKLKLIRTNPESKDQTYTHGNLFFWSETFKQWMDLCYTLEDTVRDINKNGKFDGNEKKIYGKTAIPFSPKDKPYDIEVTYSNTFKREMVLIKNVPGFEGVRIHGGNTNKDTLGCILAAYNTDNKGKIWSSAESDITNLVKQNGRKGTIEII